MSKEESSPGLLAKVVLFVKNPTTSWADLDHRDTDAASGYNKLALKEMIERKKRNDFVRKREFDMLRKMRRRELLGSQDHAVRPSFFQSSLPSTPDGRAQTLKKIDEIEAQMSMQWWKGKPGDAAATQGAAFPGASASQADHYVKTEPAHLSQRHVQSSESFAPTVPPEVDRWSEPVPMQAPVVNFSASKSSAIEIGEIAYDPELEEAAIRFANGDEAGTEEGLLEALGERGTRGGHQDTWMTLFDFYRASGQRDRFEQKALDFASRFQRSAPQWFSMPDMIRQMAVPQDAAPVSQSAHWSSPSVIGSQTLAALQAVLGKVAQPWRLDWSRVASIESAALPGLVHLMDLWGSQPVSLRFIGAEHLNQWLIAAAPLGDKTVDPMWWRLRMALLRIMYHADDFELAALNYCITYEVSPPAWEKPRCDFRSLAPDGGYLADQAIIGESFHSSFISQLSDFQSSVRDAPVMHCVSVELAGQILTDASATLDKLDAKIVGAEQVVISCARLIRIDFSAAGTLLNWVSSHHAQGHQIQFTDVNRLVAAFFQVIGINELALVVPRLD
jgi:ABC-type transporter Mla MlaB component